MNDLLLGPNMNDLLLGPYQAGIILILQIRVVGQVYSILTRMPKGFAFIPNSIVSGASSIVSAASTQHITISFFIIIMLFVNKA